MARQLLRFACVLSALTTSLAIPFQKRWNQDDLFNGRHPLQGVEVNGLFNPMESVTPHLFERASEEHGNKLKTYRDICKLLPQEKLNSLIGDHYASFITDFDFETLKSARIDTLRIPVSYNLFIPDVNRTDAHPKGEARALDVFIDRVLDHGMTVWLDLVATPTNQLGSLEEFGNTVTPEVARRVVRYISKKYHSQDVTTVLVHSDIHFPSTPAKETAFNPKSVRKTKNSQYTLYRELASILDRSGHLLAIDTTHNLDWWASKIPSFSHPVVLVHSLQTGLLSPHQHTVKRLKKGIREDLNHVKELAENVPIAVTWDASINACARTKQGTHDCTLKGQLWHAVDREPGQHENEGTLNDYVEDFGRTILMELDNAGVAAWFFRTAKLQPLDYPRRSALDEQPLKLIKRRRPEQGVSGNDFIAMYNHGMLSKISPTPAKHKHKIPPVALALGTLGTVGAGALGWWLWDDIQNFGSDAIKWFHGPQESPVDEVKSPGYRISGASDSRSMSRAPLSSGLSLAHPISPPAESSHSLVLASAHEIEHPLPPLPDIDHSLDSVPQDQPPIPAVDLNVPLPEIPAPVGNVGGQRAQAVPAEGGVAESIALPPEEGPYGGAFGDPFEGYPASGRERQGQGIVDHTELRPVNEMVEHWETPPPASEPSAERVEISDRGSVVASVARWETPQGSRIMTPASSRRHSGSEFQLSKGMSAKDAEAIRRLSDIQRDLKANGIPEQEWTPGIAVPRPRRPNSGVDVGNKRNAMLLSVEEKGLLNEMLLESMREEAKAQSSGKNRPEGQSGDISGGGKAAGYSKSDAGIEVEHDVKPDADAAIEKAPSVPQFYKSSNSKEPGGLGREILLDPEPLTHPQQELYTRPHAGTGESSLGVTMSLAKLRKDTDDQRRPKPEPHPSPQTGHHVIVSGKTRPMTVHAPRIEDLDPNHPKNLKKMKSKSEETSEYKPHPAPEFKSHHVEETKVVSKSKGPFSLPKTITTHRRESTHLHPDMATALKEAGHEVPPPPQSGIGKDPRPKFEDLHWTKEEREGHRAYIEQVRKDSANAEEEEEEEPRRSVSEWKDFRTNKERGESPQTTPSAKPKVGVATGQRTNVGELENHGSKKNEVEIKKSEPSIKSGQDGEDESHRVSVHEMTNFWTDKERKEKARAQGAPSVISEPRKSAISDRVKAFEGPAIEPVTTNSLDKDDRRPPPSQPISERVKAFDEAAAEKGKEDSVVKEDRIPPPSAPIAERVKTFEEPLKESKEEPLGTEDRNPPSEAPIAERVKTFEEGTKEPKKEKTAIEKDLDQVIDVSITHRVAALEADATRQLEESREAPAADLPDSNTENTKKPVQQRIDELAIAEMLSEGAAEAAAAAEKEPDTGNSRIDPDTKESPKLIHLTKNRARLPAKKTKPSGS